MLNIRISLPVIFLWLTFHTIPVFSVFSSCRSPTFSPDHEHPTNPIFQSPTYESQFFQTMNCHSFNQTMYTIKHTLPLTSLKIHIFEHHADHQSSSESAYMISYGKQCRYTDR